MATEIPANSINPLLITLSRIRANLRTVVRVTKSNTERRLQNSFTGSGGEGGGRIVRASRVMYLVAIVLTPRQRNLLTSDRNDETLKQTVDEAPLRSNEQILYRQVTRGCLPLRSIRMIYGRRDDILLIEVDFANSLRGRLRGPV